MDESKEEVAVELAEAKENLAKQEKSMEAIEQNVKNGGTGGFVSSVMSQEIANNYKAKIAKLENKSLAKDAENESTTSFRDTVLDKWNNSSCSSLLTNRSFIAVCSGAAGFAVGGVRGAAVGVVGSLAAKAALDGSKPNVNEEAKQELRPKL